MTFYYSTRTWNSQPQVSEDQIKLWKHLSEKKNWRITQLPNGFYQTEYKDIDCPCNPMKIIAVKNGMMSQEEKL